MEKVSVIIPMFNSEKFIETCLDSVLGQSYQDLEIIAIDDGSTDRSADLCRKIALTDERLHLHQQENAGVSAARNRGLALAEGEYVFFLDSDDAIHPLLLETLVQKADSSHADLIFCDNLRTESRDFNETLRKTAQSAGRCSWMAADGELAEQWFHTPDMSVLTAIGGKLLRRSMIGDLQFNEHMTHGEDTLFLYYFIRQNVRAAYLQKGWYYYRMHPASATQNLPTANEIHLLKFYQIIRDEEYQREKYYFAQNLERAITLHIRNLYTTNKKAKNADTCRLLRKIAAAEIRHPMFKRIPLSMKAMYFLCFTCQPAYHPATRYVKFYIRKKEAFQAKKRHANIGILTFHCADNYGAMLQAYGLKRFLRRNGKIADIIRYEPFYMTGRHWLIPYAPIYKLKRRIKIARHDFRKNIRVGGDFFRQRANMNYFRYKYLINKKNLPIRSLIGLAKTHYDYYIVGSDQIWNPEITCGFRKAYFGAFPTSKKKKVISYAASIGGAALASDCDNKFSALLRHVDAVSVREAEAVPYIRKLYDGEVTAVLDPVFFLRKASWQKAERIPRKAKEQDYIFLYATKPDETMAGYARKLSQDTGLPVIKLYTWQPEEKTEPGLDRTAGPAEFLGYIHNARYVVSNSFHAAAFSIIYEKQFLLFSYSSSDTRVRNILNVHGLSDRLYCEGDFPDINASVDWETVRQKTRALVKSSGRFLLKHLGGMDA